MKVSCLLGLGVVAIALGTVTGCGAADGASSESTSAESAGEAIDQAVASPDTCTGGAKPGEVPPPPGPDGCGTKPRRPFFPPPPGH